MAFAINPPNSHKKVNWATLIVEGSVLHLWQSKAGAGSFLVRELWSVLDLSDSRHSRSGLGKFPRELIPVLFPWPLS